MLRVRRCLRPTRSLPVGRLAGALAFSLCFALFAEVGARAAHRSVAVSTFSQVLTGSIKHTKHRKERVMEISFVRSGGFAGRATNVSGVVHFDPSGRSYVSAEGTDYHRDLTADEAKQLQSLTIAKLAEHGVPPPGDQMRDAFQYDVSAKTEDGKTHSLPLGIENQSGPHEGLASSLSEWVQRETQRIWDHRLAGMQK